MSRLPQLQRALVAAAERVEAAPARTTLRRRRVRTLAIALAELQQDRERLTATLLGRQEGDQPAHR